MKIKQTFISFSGIVKPGLLTFFIEMDMKGVDMDEDELVQSALHFNHTILFGEEPFYQKENVSKFIKKITKDNPYCNLTIYTDGTIRPSELGKNPINYMVFIGLKHTGKLQEQRLRPEVIGALSKIDTSNFIFEVKTVDDVDETLLLINSFMLKKSKSFVSPIDQDNFYDIIKYCKYKNLNIAPDFRKYFWERDGQVNTHV
jgi:hypothetical protein